jgi:predicted dehydrogenase
MSLGIALVGVGAFGRFCLDAFSKMPELRIVAVCDIDLPRAEEMAKLYGAAAYSSLETLLKNPDVAIVALNTPPYLHAKQGEMILEAGKHLFCEKPLALTMADAETLVALAESKSLLLTVNYVMRHNPLWEQVATFRETEVFGKLRHMNLANHAAGLELPDSHWFWDKTKSGGIWIEHGVHFFDAFAMVSGEAGEIMGSQSFQDARGYLDRVEAIARYGDTAAHFYHAFDQSSNSEQTIATISFEKAYISLHEWIPTELTIVSSIPHSDFHLNFRGQRQLKQFGDGRVALSLKLADKSLVYQEAIQAGMRDFIQSIENPQRPLIVQSRFALESLQMAIAAENPRF